MDSQDSEMGEDAVGASHSSLVDPGGGLEKKRRFSNETQEGNPSSKKRMDEMESHTQQATKSGESASNSQVGDAIQGKVSGSLIVEFKGKSVEQKIVYDNDTVIYLLRNSPIGPKYSGKPRFNYNGHSLNLYIDDDRDIEELLKIDRLIDQEEEWPVVCRRPKERPTMRHGVLKWINLNVDTVRIKNSLIRNGEKSNGSNKN